MRRILLIIQVSCILIFLFVCGKYTFFDNVMQNANYGMRSINAEKEISSLFIGSSMFRQGINTTKLDENSFLLAYNGNQPALEKLQLEEMLSHGANIKQLVVDMYPYSAASELNISDSRIFMDGNLCYSYRVFSLVKETKGYSYLMNIFLQANNDTFVTWSLTHRLVNQRYYRGANTSSNRGASKDMLDNIDIDLPKMECLNEDQKQGIKGIIECCREHNIKLIFIESPKYYRIHENDDYLTLMKEYKSFLESYDVDMIICNRTAEALNFIDDDRIMTYSFNNENALCFIDLIHLSSDGRDKFSCILKSKFDELEKL